MKKFTLILLIVVGFAGTSAIMKEDGRAGATGSPGETTCNTSQCHTGNVVNSGGGSIVIAAPTMPGWMYVPGQVYPISVTVSKAGTPLFGLGFEALRSTGANGGTLSITTPAETQIKVASIGGNLRSNVVHQLNGGLTSNAHTFTFNWTAPLAGTGTVTFYAAGNAANDNGNTSGDFIYTVSQVITESATGLFDYATDKFLQLYPNPSSGEFNISFELDEPSPVSIEMIDLSGKVISQILSRPVTSGSHEINHEADSSLPTGIYFIRLTIDNQVWIKKVAVL